MQHVGEDGTDWKEKFDGVMLALKLDNKMLDEDEDAVCCSPDDSDFDESDEEVAKCPDSYSKWAPREINPMFNGDLRKLIKCIRITFPLHVRSCAKTKKGRQTS